MSKTKSLKRRAKFTVALLAVTASFVGGTQALAPTSASALTYKDTCLDPFLDWSGWARCEWDRHSPNPI